MRRGIGAALVFDKHGQIFAISTGSDAASEHEWGSKPLQESLCAATVQDDRLVQMLRQGQAVSYPSLIDRKAIRRNLDQLQFVVGEEGGEAVAVFGYSPYYGLRSMRIDNRELVLGTKECVGAWDSKSFAIKVRGAKLVAKLKRFADAVKAGNAMFAGTFLKKDGNTHLTGVIVALATSLRPEHRQEIKKVQVEWENNLQLKAHSRV